jgi:hypothetical protein
MNPTTREVFTSFLGRDRSVGEAAEALGRGIDAVLYRVRRLHAAGLLEVVDRVARRGRPIRRYRAPHDAWFIPFEVLPYADLEEAFLALTRSQAEQVARASAHWLVRRPWAGYHIGVDAAGRPWMTGAGAGGAPASIVGDVFASGRPPSGPGDHPLDASLELRLSHDDVRALNADLTALVATYLAREQPGGSPNRLLIVYSVPLDGP